MPEVTIYFYRQWLHRPVSNPKPVFFFFCDRGGSYFQVDSGYNFFILIRLFWQWLPSRYEQILCPEQRFVIFLFNVNTELNVNIFVINKKKLSQMTVFCLKLWDELLFCKTSSVDLLCSFQLKIQGSTSFFCWFKICLSALVVVVNLNLSISKSWNTII